MKNIAIIGAGNIAVAHLEAYKANPDATVVAICDMNLELAKERAEKYDIPKVYSDYHDVLADPTVDAVSVVTPTFTHGSVVLDALNAGKDVLCEKPPALTYAEALANEEAAKKNNKVLMYAFVIRFDEANKFLKEYIDSGRMGDIYYAETYRMCRADKFVGWFVDKKKSGGGMLMDGAIHQLDLVLYLMGYPKVKSVKGYTSDVNRDLPDHIKGHLGGYISVDNKVVERTVESFASGYITFENGKNLFIKAATVANTLNPGAKFELMGDRGGVCVDDKGMRLLTVDETGYFIESQPQIAATKGVFHREIGHFIDCCHGRAECICTAHQGSEIIKIINAIYESAETGKEIVF